MAGQEDWTRLTARFPPDLSEQLRKAAEASGRSVNAEVVARLRASLAPQGVQEAPGAYPAESAPKVVSGAQVDRSLLEGAVEAGEIYLKELGRELPPEKKAKLIGLLYDFYKDEATPHIDKATVIRLIDLAS